MDGIAGLVRRSLGEVSESIGQFVNLSIGQLGYGLDWTETELKFYVDGQLVRKGPNDHWHQPLKMCFDCETMPDWFGLPKDKDLPSTYSIKYVRSWKRAE